ncbi:GerMN domain-containing protein [Nesterenkonia halotolerans]|uniref:GerMN domain-containing protein n=1 Tax=Nesterenkonia halotolerans TaxID=225325 RepID=UPI003EE736FC
MTPTRSSRTRNRWVAASLGLTVLVSGCGDSSETEQEQTEETGSSIPQPEYDADDSVRLPLAMISPAEQNQEAPLDEDGSLESSEAPGSPVEEESNGQQAHEIEIARTEAFGCGDTLSVIQTVPMVTEDPAVAALEYLISDELYSHGSPAFGNPLSASEDLSVDSVELEGDTVTVQLSGEAVTSSECESWQILTQIETTARAATGATDSEVRLEGQPLAEVLGLGPAQSPVEIREITD